MVLVHLISDNQNAFIEGKEILDVVLFANELVGSRIRNGRSGVICKLDIEKAYDYVKWEFIIYILKRMDFGKQVERVDELGHSQYFFCSAR